MFQLASKLEKPMHAITREAMRKLVREANVVIGAVLVAGAKAPNRVGYRRNAQNHAKRIGAVAKTSTIA